MNIIHMMTARFPLLTIIVPLYNTEKYIGECLESLEGLSGLDHEIILIDDGSTDKSLHIASSFASRNKNIKLLTQENKGLGYTRNYAVSLSRGAYLSFLDSDDKINPQAYIEMLSRMISEGADIAIGMVAKFNNKNKIYKYRVNNNFKNYGSSVKSVTECPTLIYDTIACNKIYKHTFWLENNLKFIENRYYEDIYTVTKAMICSKSITLVNKTAYYWRTRNDSANKSITQRRLEIDNMRDRLYSLNKIVDLLIKEGQKSLTEKFFEKFLTHDLPLYSFHLSNTSRRYQDFFWKNYICILKKSPKTIKSKLTLEVHFYVDLWIYKDERKFYKAQGLLAKRPNNKYLRRIYMQIVYIILNPRSLKKFSLNFFNLKSVSICSKL